MKNKTHKKKYLQPETEIKPIETTIPPRETTRDSVEERAPSRRYHQRELVLSRSQERMREDDPVKERERSVNV